MSVSIRGVVLFICVFLSSLGEAQEIPALSIHEVLEIAYQDNPRMSQARKAIDVSKGDLITARGLADPQVEIEIGGLKKNEEGKRKGHLDSIAFKQSFDPLGVHFLKSKIAKNNVFIKQEALKSVWSEVYLELRTVYAKIILDNKELELKRNNLKSMRQFFSHVQLRYEGGQTLKNNLQRAKIELLKGESDYLEAENHLTIEKARMNLMLGRPRDTAFNVKEELKEESLTQGLDELIELALAQRPDLKMEQLHLNSKINVARKEQLNRLPSYWLGFQRTNESYDKDYSALIGVSVPLWSLNQGEVKKAVAEREAQRIKLESMKNEISFEVYAAYQEVQLVLRQQELFKKSLEEANEMFRLAGLSYGEGRMDFISYLDQVQASMGSRMQYYQGLYRLGSSISSLEKSIYSSLRGEEFLK